MYFLKKNFISVLKTIMNMEQKVARLEVQITELNRKLDSILALPEIQKQIREVFYL